MISTLTALTENQKAYGRKLFEGMHQRDAYIEVYHAKYNLASIDANASRLANSEKLLAYLAELHKKAEAASVSTVLERKQILTNIQRTTVGDFVDEYGNLDITDKSKLKNPAVQEIKTERTVIGVRTTLKLRDPIAAIAEHNRMEGVGKDADDGGTGDRIINIIVSSEAAKILTESLAQRFLPSPDVTERK